MEGPRVTGEEMAAVLLLDGPQRFMRFVRVVADFECAWGLWDDGWATYADAAGSSALPLWPARAYAAACATDDWVRFMPKAIEVSELLHAAEAALARDAAQVAVFPTPSGRGVLVAWSELVAALHEELARYS